MQTTSFTSPKSSKHCCDSTIGSRFNSWARACIDPPRRTWVVTKYISTMLNEWLHGRENKYRETMMPLPPFKDRVMRTLEIAQAMHNIFLNDALHVRVADFGHARFLGGQEMALMIIGPTNDSTDGVRQHSSKSKHITQQKSSSVTAKIIHACFQSGASLVGSSYCRRDSIGRANWVKNHRKNSQGNMAQI
ncbi:hypothetical protein CR513_15365, partial [Mucuna pruriens]